MMNIYKKDYEPYQALGPLCGIFDQRAAEKLVRHADSYGFDAITIGGILAWLMDCLEKDLLSPADLGLKDKPIFSMEHFKVESDSMHNASLGGVLLLDKIIKREQNLDLYQGGRELEKELSEIKKRD